MFLYNARPSLSSTLAASLELVHIVQIIDLLCYSLSKFQRFSFIEHQIQYDQNSNFESPGETPKSQAYTEVRHFETSSQ